MNDDTLADTQPAKVLPFKPRVVTSEVTPSNPNTPNAALVKLFDDYAKAARAGSIQFAAIATVDSNGVGYSSWEPEESTPQVLIAAVGSVSFLNHRFSQSILDGAEPSDPYNRD